MTYTEAYNDYVLQSESKIDKIENLIAEELRTHGMFYKENFEYCSFLETARIQIFNTNTSTKELYDICKKALGGMIPEPKISVFKSESVDKVEFTINVDLY